MGAKGKVTEGSTGIRKPITALTGSNTYVMCGNMLSGYLKVRKVCNSSRKSVSHTELIARDFLSILDGE